MWDSSSRRVLTFLVLLMRLFRMCRLLQQMSRWILGGSGLLQTRISRTSTHQLKRMTSEVNKISKTGQIPVQVWSWNIRGLGDYAKADSKIRHLNDFLTLYADWDFFLIQEHKLDDMKMQDQVFGVCNLYAPCRIRDRNALWRRLQGQLDFQVTWLVGGDYNFVEETSDKFGGVPPHIRHVWMEWHGFRDLHMLMCDPWVVHPAQQRRGSLQFSWTNEREIVADRVGCGLDRIYVPLSWVEHVVEYDCFAGTDPSDHAPAFLNQDLAEGHINSHGSHGYKIWRINESLLAEKNMRNKIGDIWKEQHSATNKGGISKLLRALDETRVFLEVKGRG